MAVKPGGLAVGSPSSVCNTGMRVKDLVHVDTRLCHKFSEFGHLAHLFECEDLILLVAINCEAGGVVASIFEAGEAYKA